MFVKYLCRRQCFILLITLGSLLSIYLFMVNKAYSPQRKKTDILKYYYALNGKLSGNVAGAKVVREGNVVKIPLGNVESNECKVNSIDPYSEKMMKYMHDFGDHKCTAGHNVELDIKFNKVKVSGVGIDFVRSREIIPGTDIFHLKDFVFLMAPQKKHILKRDWFGALRNEVSRRCVVPVHYSGHNRPAEIEVMFSSQCDGEEAVFTFTKDGLLFHNVSNKCLGPKGGTPNPPDNTPLVLSQDCNTKFDVIGQGVLKMVGTSSCVHNLWGGNLPAEGQKLCFFASCVPDARLTYHWYSRKIGASARISEEFTLANELSNVQVSLSDDVLINTFVLSVIAKPLPPNVNAKPPNIFILSIDEASGPHFKRKLPQTYKLMTKMGFQEFEIHAALFPKAVDNLMATFRGRLHSEKEDDCIFNIAKKSNYVSMLSSDEPDLNMVNVSDHNTLPLFQAIKRNVDLTAQSNCIAGQPIYDLTLNYLLSFINAYPSHPKLGILLLSQITLSNFNYLGYMDKSFMNTLIHLAKLENTVILVQTLKGGLSGKLGQIDQGVEESKRLLLASYVSKDIRDKYNFETSRTSKLTTVLDVYATLRHLISNQTNSIGRTLFEKAVPRNCKQAFVPPPLCPCL